MPDTLSYLLLGLAAITIIMTLLIASIVVRFRNAQQDLRLLRDLDNEQQG